MAARQGSRWRREVMREAWRGVRSGFGCIVTRWIAQAGQVGSSVARYRESRGARRHRNHAVVATHAPSLVRLSVRMDRRIASTLLAFVAAISTFPQARAAEALAHVEILETDPGHDIELAPRAALHARVRYDSLVPIRIQARAYKGGVEQQASMMNPSPVYPAGQGEAIAWLAFD